MATKISAGILLYRRVPALEVLLAHPGGPFWKNRDEGAWGLPKGEVAAGEDVLAAARREFLEETGFAPGGEALALGSVRLKGGKLIHAWGIEGDFDPHARRDFHDLIHRLSDFENTTILMTTHDLDEAEKIADRILVLDEGRIVADGSADQLARELTTTAEVHWTSGGRRHVHAVLKGDPSEFVRDLLIKNPDVTELEVRRASLEDTYMALVRRVESGQSRAGVRPDETGAKDAEVQA